MYDMRDNSRAIDGCEEGHSAPCECMLVTRDADDAKMRRWGKVFDCPARVRTVRSRKKNPLARHRTRNGAPSRITEIRDDALPQGSIHMFGVKRGLRMRCGHSQFIIRYGYEFDEKPSILWLAVSDAANTDEKNWTRFEPDHDKEKLHLLMLSIHNLDPSTRDVQHVFPRPSRISTQCPPKGPRSLLHSRYRS